MAKNKPGIPPRHWNKLKDAIEKGMSDKEILDKHDVTPENVKEMRKILKEKGGKKAEALHKLVSLANHLDHMGYHDEARELDGALESFAAEYQGKKVKLNDPIRNPKGSKKKFRVYVRDPKTKKVKKIQFGDPNMEIKRDDKDRRKSFRARHNCDNPGPKTKARYWSCYQWRKNKKVDN